MPQLYDIPGGDACSPMASHCVHADAVAFHFRDDLRFMAGPYPPRLNPVHRRGRETLISYAASSA
jgi:hypothetical protein